MRRALTILLLLAGCTQAAAPRGGAEFAPDSGGLSVVGSAQRVDFGRSPQGVIPVLDRELGAHRTLPLELCPGGIVQQLAWGDLVLTFDSERFVGWRQGARASGRTCVSGEVAA